MKHASAQSCLTLLFAIVLTARGATAFAAADEISFSKQVRPILNKSCIACHKPEKKKGKLDLTSFAGLSGGGENGKIVIPADVKKSALIEQIIPHGDEKPAMPDKGESLAVADVAIITNWVAQGAKDDTPAAEIVKAGYAQPGPQPPSEAQVYKIAPVIDAIALSPDDKTLAVAGRSEVLLVDALGLAEEPKTVAKESAKVTARLPFASPRITSLIYSPDGHKLYAAGGTPGQFGQVQVWDVDSKQVRQNWRISGDVLFGLSVSPDGATVAFGCTDRSVRMMALADGKELLNVQAHSDWVFGTAFSGDGNKLIATGRDKCVKVISLPSGQPIVDVNEPEEPSLCLAKSPAGEIVVVGGANGSPRIYRTADLQPRTEQKKDPNQLKQCDRLNGPVNAVAFSRDGAFFVAGATGEARIFKKEGGGQAKLSGATGPINAVGFSPDGKWVYTAGFDAKVRVYEAGSGRLVREFILGMFDGK